MENCTINNSSNNGEKKLMYHLINKHEKSGLPSIQEIQDLLNTKLDRGSVGFILHFIEENSRLKETINKLRERNKELAEKANKFDTYYRVDQAIADVLSIKLAKSIVDTE